MWNVLLAAALTWQMGVWSGAESRPISGGVVHVAHVEIPLPPTSQETFTLDGAGLRFVVEARPSEHLSGVIVRDTVLFALDGADHLRVKLAGKTYKLRIVSRTRPDEWAK